MSTLEKEIEEWQRIRRGEQAYGEGRPSEQATRYYFEAMMEDIVAAAQQRWAVDRREDLALDCDLLISMSGFSPATTILAYRLLKPRRIFVVSSENAQDGIDIIHRFIVGTSPDRLPPRCFHHQTCDPTQPHAIYRLVKEELERLKSPASKDGRSKAIIDLTGGKKVMSAAAALVAWRLDLRLCYIDSEFDPGLRQPRPGTERMILLDNPMTLYGDEELRRVNEVFKSGHFGEAKARFEKLAESTGDPLAKFMRDFSELYRAWCDLDLASLPKCLDRVEEQLANARVRERLRDHHADKIRRQISILRRLDSKDAALLLACFFVLGLHYQNLERFDFAALLLYRTIEGCWRQRLESRYEGFSTRTPDYRLLGVDEKILLGKYNNIADFAGPGQREKELPRWLGFLNSAALLLALDDPMCNKIPLAPQGIGEVLALSNIRNGSVLAHGNQSITQQDCNKLVLFAQRVLNAFWSVSGEESRVEHSVTELREILEFVRMEL